MIACQSGYLREYGLHHGKDGVSFKIDHFEKPRESVSGLTSAHEAENACSRAYDVTVYNKDRPLSELSFHECKHAPELSNIRLRVNDVIMHNTQTACFEPVSDANKCVATNVANGCTGIVTSSTGLRQI